MHAVPIATIAQVMGVGETLHVQVAHRTRAIHGGVNAGCSSAPQRRTWHIVVSVVSSHVIYLRPILTLTILLVRGMLLCVLVSWHIVQNMERKRLSNWSRSLEPSRIEECFRFVFAVL